MFEENESIHFHKCFIKNVSLYFLSEWRTFSNDKDSKDRSRVGDVENRLLSNSGSDLSTMIGPMGNGQMNEEYSKFNNRRQMNATDRALISSFREITSMADRLHLEARTVDKAKANFKEVYESRSLKGRSNDAIAAACLYIACRQEQVPRTFKVSKGHFQANHHEHLGNLWNLRRGEEGNRPLFQAHHQEFGKVCFGDNFGRLYGAFLLFSLAPKTSSKRRCSHCTNGRRP